MNRRTLLAAAVAVVVGGCVTASSGKEPASDGNESESDDDGTEPADDSDRSASATDAPSDDAVLEQFESSLEVSGLEGIDLAVVGAKIDLGYDATGPTEADVAAEIELITDGYTALVEDGTSTTQLEATAYHSTDGKVLDRFAIETEWVDVYLEGSIEWHELLAEVGTTFESLELDDSNGEGSGNGDENGSENDDS